MNIICYIKGHKKNEDIEDIKFIFTKTKGTIDYNYKLCYCDRCKQLYFEKKL